MFLSQLNFIYTQFSDLSKSNPIVAGAVSLWGLSVLTFILKGVPARIWGFFKHHLTTTLTINSADSIFYDFLAWVNDRKIDISVRSFNFNNSSRFGWGHAQMTIGYGLIFFRFGSKIMSMRRFKIDANQTSESKETITISIIGRNSKIFADIFLAIQEKKNEDKKYIRIYTYSDGWKSNNKIYKRGLETITIPKENRQLILNHVNGFINSKDWYLGNGIPYRTGILFHGPAGTGKTSLIKAICAEFGKDLYVIDANSMGDTTIRNAMSSVPEGAIVALEEIDTISSSRAEIVRSDESSNEPVAKEIKLSLLSMSGLLNALDGIVCGEGRIVIATTNYPEKLDPALVREGRFDLKIHVGYFTNETLMLYMKRLYPEINKWGSWKIKPNIAPCKVQKLVFDHRDNPLSVLKEIADQVVGEESEFFSEEMLPSHQKLTA